MGTGILAIWTPVDRMRSDFLPFCRPSIDDVDIAAVEAVLRSGWITTGPKTAELEEAFAARTGADHAVAFCSATAAMHCLMLAAGVGPGDEIATPSLTWVSTVNLIELLGATPVFVDVDRDTLLASPEAMAAAITPRTKAIVPVHYAGAPVDLPGFRDVAARHGVALWEDAAHAIGTRFGDEEIGATGTGIFSLHPIKNVTSGEGGVLVTDDADLAARVRRLRFHGLGADAHDRNQQGRSPQVEVLEPGLKYNLPDMNAALGVSQMPRLDAFIERRDALVRGYRERLANLDELVPLADPAWPHRHARHLFIVRQTDASPLSRDAFMAALKARNIGTGIHFKAVHRHAHYRERYPEVGRHLPHSEWNSDRLCSLPLFPDMTESDLDDVVAAIEDAYVEARSTSVAGASR